MALPRDPGGGGWTRRGFLRGQQGQPLRVGVGLVTEAVYREWVRDYRSGRFVETARKVSERSVVELREAQRDYLDALPSRDDPRGFRARVAAAILHAEALARFGWNQSSHIRLLEDPCRSLPDRWIAGLPPSFGEDAVAAWGDRAWDPRRILFREAVLAAARPRLAVLSIPDANRILEQAGPDDDPAIRWQLAAIWAFRARYVREDGLWREVTDALRQRTVRELVPPDIGRASPHVVARAMSDPDDRRLRFALASLGMNRRASAEDHLAGIRPDLWDRLLVPHRLLAGEALMKASRFGPAARVLREAAEAAPASQPAAAAYAAALQASGRWEEAAALARDRLDGGFARGIEETAHPWLSFLLTWADPTGPEFEWLRSLIAA